ncbi:type II toxin-antitoxin system RelE/ParE family toxin [Phenylobacterium sp. VNQ135]|uniref:type II toxin-antitoxin system RelE/ParE family toxin n=1 Tax=Phenylobacterium sp. VNQ135 TaxID=3400922 RepID=UPI003C0FC0C7
MSVYATKEFARFARKAGLASPKLVEASADVVAGRFDADLGGGVFKQRVAREGGGKSGGFRTIIVFKVGGHSFFVHGFAKSDKANVSAKELKALKALAGVLTGLSAEGLRTATSAGELVELESEPHGGGEAEG